MLPSRPTTDGLVCTADGCMLDSPLSRLRSGSAKQGADTNPQRDVARYIRRKAGANDQLLLGAPDPHECFGDPGWRPDLG